MNITNEIEKQTLIESCLCVNSESIKFNKKQFN